MDNLKLVDTDEDMVELLNLMEGWAENKYEIKHPNPFEMIIEMYYKEWGNVSTIKYNIHANTFRCKSSVRSTRQIKNTEAIRKQLKLLYIKYTIPTPPPIINDVVEIPVYINKYDEMKRRFDERQALLTPAEIDAQTATANKLAERWVKKNCKGYIRP